MREIYKIYEYNETDLGKIQEGIFVIPEVAGDLETAEKFIKQNKGDYIVVRESRVGDKIKIQIWRE